MLRSVAAVTTAERPPRTMSSVQPHPDHLSDGDRSAGGMDRRAALRRAAVAGAITWAAPAVLSTTVHAQAVGCTQKCLPVASPQSSPTASVTCGGNGNNRRVDVSVPILTSILCPCNGDDPIIALDGNPESNWPGSTIEVVQGSVVVVQLGDVARPPLEVNILITATCTDRDPADGGCVRTCQTTVTVPVSLQNSGNCNGLNFSPTASVTTTCT
jgi:hypothetical protein